MCKYILVFINLVYVNLEKQNGKNKVMIGKKLHKSITDKFLKGRLLSYFNIKIIFLNFFFYEITLYI